MPQIQLLDGKKIDFEKSITGFDLTKKFDVETMCQSNLKEYKRLIKN